MKDQHLEDAYRYCLDMAKNHYENFPVASYMLPARLRLPVSVIYAYARTADDIADEGNLTADQRLHALDELENQLDSCAQGNPTEHPVFIALSDVIQKYRLPLQPLKDLLQAFRIDVTKKRYESFAELMQYCRLSANPVGRLLLHLYGASTDRNIGYSDAVCSALQLINFLQDLEQDYQEKGRIYLPQDEMQRFGVTEEMIAKGSAAPGFRSLLDFQIRRAAGLLQSGAPIGVILKGRIGLELRMIILGGSRILKKLHQNRENPFARPRLGINDWVYMLIRALFAKFTVYFSSRPSTRTG